MDISVSKIISIYNSRSAQLRFYAMRFTGSLEESEDVVHSVFEKIISKEVEFKREDSVVPYLFSAVRNSCLNLLKREKTGIRYSEYLRRFGESDNSDIEFLNSRIENEVLWEIFSAIGKLPSGCRTIFNMSYLQNAGNKEIAAKLGISENTVKSQKSRAKLLLKKSLRHIFSFFLLF